MRISHFILTFALLVLIAPVVHAKIFWYSDDIDRQRAIEYAQQYPHDGIDADRFANPRDYSCFDLDAYNQFAASNRYDEHDDLNAGNIEKKDLKRLGREDYNRIANEKPYDSIRADNVNSYTDTSCWTLGDYNRFANTKQHDKFRPVYFQDWDDLETVQRIGTERSHFFVPDDFVFFDLQRTEPRRFWMSADDALHPSNFEYFRWY